MLKETVEHGIDHPWTDEPGHTMVGLSCESNDDKPEFDEKIKFYEAHGYRVYIRGSNDTGYPATYLIKKTMIPKFEKAPYGLSRVLTNEQQAELDLFNPVLQAVQSARLAGADFTKEMADGVIKDIDKEKEKMADFLDAIEVYRKAYPDKIKNLEDIFIAFANEKPPFLCCDRMSAEQEFLSLLPEDKDFMRCLLIVAFSKARTEFHNKYMGEDSV